MSESRVLLIDKPRGPTSHDVVARARRALAERRIGHTGTLDPFADGLLVLCVGPATRIAEYLTGRSKSYEATLRLGVETDSLDDEGEVFMERPVPALDEATIEHAFSRFAGTISQRPPAFSAKRIGGERAYERARRGETVELDPVEVTVHELEVTRVALPEVDFRCTVSSGTYVRAIGRDVGTALGTGGHLTALRRTSVGELEVGNAVPLGGIEGLAGVAPGDGNPAVLSPAEALAHLPGRDLDAGEARDLSHGRRLSWDRDDTEIATVRFDGALAAIGAVTGGEFRPRKVFLTPQSLPEGGGSGE